MTKCKRKQPFGWYCTRDTHLDPDGVEVVGPCALKSRWYESILVWLRGGH